MTDNCYNLKYFLSEGDEWIAWNFFCCIIRFQANIWYSFQNKYKEKYEKEKGQPTTITTDTPELRRIKKVQDQLSEVGCIAKINHTCQKYASPLGTGFK